MKRAIFAILIITTLVANGCATAGLNCDEKCATYGMACEGISSGSYRGTGYAYGSGPVTVSGDSSGVNCRKPASESESSAIQANAASASEKESAARKKNIILGVVGAAALIVIGILGQQRDSAIKNGTY